MTTVKANRCPRCRTLGCDDPDSKSCSDNILTRYRDALELIAMTSVKDVERIRVYAQGILDTGEGDGLDDSSERSKDGSAS